MNRTIEEILQTGVVKDQSGQEYLLKDHVDGDEGRFLFDLIASDDTIQKTLEIGCAYGLSSLYICSALAERDAPKHLILDPFQFQEYQGIGVLNLQRAGFDFFELKEARSEFALPDLAEHQSGTFDLVLIDGNHTFDHTLLDLFYANRLIKVGGYIVVDDCNMAPVSKAVSYVSQYPSYRISHQSQPPITLIRAAKKAVRTILPMSIAQFVIPHYLYDLYYVRTRFSSMVALQKMAEDDRAWNWFQPF